MSRVLTTEEIKALSAAMEAAGELGYEDFCIMLNIARFSTVQREGLFPCPRCGRYRMDRTDPIRNALSRHAEIQVCDPCGTEEAILDFTGSPMPLKDWAIARSPKTFIRD